MRFFSNEAKDNVDEPGTDDRTEPIRSEPDRSEQAPPEQAQSERDRSEQARPQPAAVPQQRAGSPWQDGPVIAEPPAPQPTAFGASTVGGAVAASAMAGPHEPAGHHTDRTTDAASGVADDRTVAFGDGADRTAAAGDGTGRATDDDDDRTVAFSTRTDQDRTIALGTVADGRDSSARADDSPRRDDSARRDDEVAWPSSGPGAHRDTADTDRRSEAGTTADLDTADIDTAAGRGSGFATEDRTVDGVLEDRGTFDDPHLKSRTDEDDLVDLPLEDHDTSAEPQVVTPVPQTEKDQPTGPSPFFPTSDVNALKERWRDVQLRFVDDPKGATAEAASLVDEAVDTLTEALKQQRGGLSKGSDDTETLRVELRSYRDILDRLLGL